MNIPSLENDYETYLIGLLDVGKRYSQKLFFKTSLYAIVNVREYHYDVRNPEYLNKIGLYLIQSSKTVAVHMISFDVTKLILSKNLPIEAPNKRNFYAKVGAVVFSNLLTEIIFYRQNGAKAILIKATAKTAAFIIGDMIENYISKKYPGLQKRFMNMITFTSQSNTQHQVNTTELNDTNPVTDNQVNTTEQEINETNPVTDNN